MRCSRNIRNIIGLYFTIFSFICRVDSSALKSCPLWSWLVVVVVVVEVKVVKRRVSRSNVVDVEFVPLRRFDSMSFQSKVSVPLGDWLPTDCIPNILMPLAITCHCLLTLVTYQRLTGVTRCFALGLCCDIHSYGSSAHPTQRMICVVLARYFEILFVHITGHRDPAQPVSLYR